MENYSITYLDSVEIFNFRLISLRSGEADLAYMSFPEFDCFIM